MILTDRFGPLTGAPLPNISGTAKRVDKDNDFTRIMASKKYK